ncbi:MAG: flagellar basal-body rod protein FlgF [Rickettsiales bacterium]
MDNGIYVMLSRQLSLFRDMQATANNIANTNTVGFKGEHMLFTSYLEKDVNLGEQNPMAFAHDISTYLNTEGGPVTVTGNPLDFAVQGNGYFAVETPLGTRYTRAGNFQLDSIGTLVTADGKPVLDAAGQRIVFPEETTDIEIGETGTLKVNGDEFSTLGIFEFPNEQLLQRLDNQLFKSEIVPQVSLTARVMQGTLEKANVQPIMEMTHMMEVSRSVASTAKYIEVAYDLQRKTNNAWAQQG